MNTKIPAEAQGLMTKAREKVLANMALRLSTLAATCLLVVENCLNCSGPPRMLLVRSPRS